MLINGKKFGVRCFRLISVGKEFQPRIPSTLHLEDCQEEIRLMNKARKRSNGVYVTLINIVDNNTVVSRGISICSKKEAQVGRWQGQRKAMVNAIRGMGVARPDRKEIFSYLDEKANKDRQHAMKQEKKELQ